MSNQNKVRTFGAAIAASAVALVILAQAAHADPAPGTCNASFEIGAAPSAAGAQQVWVNNVVAKFGTKWAQWVGAKNKTIVPMNNGTYYSAVAKPCFYQPVL